MPYYYFEAGNIGWTNGSRVGAMLQVGTIGGMLFLDENADGVYNATEPKLSNQPVNLYLGGSLHSTSITDSNGVYTFSGLNNGIYKVDFKGALGSHTYFTRKGTGDISLISQVEYRGTDA
jgi:protocatechuate 3,4-dioxygenase beta subunit